VHIMACSGCKHAVHVRATRERQLAISISEEGGVLMPRLRQGGMSCLAGELHTGGTESPQNSLGSPRNAPPTQSWCSKCFLRLSAAASNYVAGIIGGVADMGTPGAQS
jgi:hypothetical protein